MAGKDLEVNKNQGKAKQMGALLVDLKEEIQNTMAVALATQAQSKHEPLPQQQQPGLGP